MRFLVIYQVRIQEINARNSLKVAVAPNPNYLKLTSTFCSLMSWWMTTALWWCIYWIAAAIFVVINATCFAVNCT